MFTEEQKALVERILGRKARDLLETILAQELQEADAIVLLQGEGPERVKAARSLYKKGFASVVVVTGNNVRVEELKDIYLEELEKKLLEGGVSQSAILLDDKALNTEQQAAHTIRLAKEKGWSKLIVVACVFHALRAFLTFSKEAATQTWEGSILIHAAEHTGSATVLETELEKIKKYDLTPQSNA